MKRERGQALVLVLLSLAVVLTIVLFVLARSITDIAVSSRSEEAVRAFSAAEAGIENALVIGTGGTSSPDFGGGTSSYTSSVAGFAQGQTSFVYPIELNSGDSITVWLKSQDASADYTGSNLKICWGRSDAGSSPNPPAIEVIVLYETTAGDLGTARIYRAAFDSDAARRVDDSFAAAGTGCTAAGQSFAFQNTISLATLPNPQFARVRMFYNDATQPVGFDSTDSHTFPSQGQDISSTGSAGNANRKVQVFQSWPEHPAVFDFAIYSGGGLTK